MKKLVLSFAILALMTAMSFSVNGASQRVQSENPTLIAQQRQKQGEKMATAERVTKQLATYQKKLSLTEDQAGSIKKVLTENAEAMDTKMKAAMESGSRPDRSEILKIKEKENKDVRALLTDDQATKFDKLIESQKKGMKGKRGNKRR